MAIDFTELQALLGVIAQTNITELNLKTDEFELSVSKAVTASGVVSPLPEVPAAVIMPTPAVVPTPAPPPAESPTPTPVDQKWVAITSPMVGTFYRAPAPGEAPFVDAGDSVGKGQVVCIIEAMKLMNEIEAEVAGQVMEIVAENGEPVEYGQTLMWIKP